jgi:hypothetical protein
MKKSVLAVVCACLLIPAVVSADNNMRDYIAAPPDTLLSLLYYHHITGDTFNVHGDKAADVDFTEELFLLREVYYFNMGSLLANAQVIVPFGNASLDVGGSDQSSSGIGDIILLGTLWFINQPATKTYLAFSPYFFLPTGEYDNDQGVNMGTNRWAFREEINFTKGFEMIPNHTTYFEVTVGGDFFTTNTDYLGGQDLSQDPIFNLESHLSYDLTKELSISFDYYGHWGGSTELDNIEVDNSEVNSQTIGGTLAYNFAPGWQVLLQYKEDVKNDNGIEAEVIQARVFYATDFGNLFH